MNYIFKSKISNHKEIKQILLDQINLIPLNPMKNEKDNIIHTDWNLPRTMHREYFNLFQKIIEPHLQKVMRSLKASECEIGSYWFQRYGKNGSHTWHSHPSCHYANVYFLECPKGSSTKFKHFTKECEEGDILSFPAFLPHCSPTIEDDSIKTVIAFNADFLCR